VGTGIRVFIGSPWRSHRAVVNGVIDGDGQAA
jgi:hypothetical protein